MSNSKTHKPRKRFGQNFLIDIAVVQSILNTIAPRPEDHIVEIGPGLGVMTQAILPLVKRLDAVELDRDLVDKLNATVLPLGNFTIHSADALKFDFCSLAKHNQKLRVVGNLPYNISTPLVFHLIQQLECIADMHFMLQKEVVERLAASPATSAYGKLSVMVQYYCYVEKLFDVPPSAFSPAPKVDSSVVRLTPYRQLPVQVKDLTKFEKIVSAAFAQRRKTLHNNLKNLMNDEQMLSVGIDPGRRGETLTIAEFAALSNLYDTDN